jgi:5-methylcytosine-specific restriction endonuclease McrA
MPWRCALCGRPSRVSVLEIKRMTGWPNGRPGYEADHIVPLSRGGADKPSNIQWLTIPAHRGKTRWELEEQELTRREKRSVC